MGFQIRVYFDEIKAVGISKFQQYLIDRKINHILGRVRQTNGKIERFYETFQSKIEHFNSMDEFVTWYNTETAYVIELGSVRNTNPSILQKERQKEEPTTLYY